MVAEDSAAVVWLETGEGMVIEEEEVGNFILYPFELMDLQNSWIGHVAQKLDQCQDSSVKAQNVNFFVMFVPKSQDFYGIMKLQLTQPFFFLSL